ncbi:MAG: hypothetical protein OXG92_10040 [Chloroflexi bacterium]|nr:hypothetical protein [Chloroflexota bacterium]MCY3581193.1 hypothetical protein [Chloroflexota bacterium]MCY3716791.1 hypothetical protein [Chloroflexota bacterium]MDE2649158.1 hypothetical protein [Chloroflexota bacterium]MXV92419.1 hypothetical protein [Chloroflexota bacterium]
MLALLLALGGWTSAQDESPYFQSAAFNVPILAGWENQSGAGIAQFHNPAARATIRSAMADGADAPAAAAADLAGWQGLSELDAPVYSGKVNLADGTWHVLAYDLDEGRSASQIARRADDRFIVISFLESDPASRTLMLAIAQADESLESPAPELDSALQQVTPLRLAELAAAGAFQQPGGDWLVYHSETARAAGSIFGNDSYIALQTGSAGEQMALGDFLALADAWQSTALGFFITPDNSLYLWLGVAVSLLMLLTLIGSFAWRARGLRKDLAMLEKLASADAD